MSTFESEWCIQWNVETPEFEEKKIVHFQF